MTASKVTQVNPYAGSPQSTTQVKSNQTDDFSKIFASQSAENGTKTQPKQETITKEEDKTEDVTDVKEEKTVDKISEAKTEELQEVSETKDTEKVVQSVDEEELDTEAVAEAMTEIMAVIQKVLGVTTEELQSAMDELGISAEDLLNTEMIPKLVVALTEGADELSVMTNENLFANVQEITSKVESILKDLADQTNLSPDALKEMVQNMPKAEIAVEEETVTTVLKDDLTDVPMLEENRIQVSIERTVTSHSAKEDRQGNNTGADQQMTFAQTVSEQIEQAVAKTETTYSTFSTTESIMNQIQDVIKVIQTQDLTEMELQLHPASLGHVKVQITVNEGILTAIFITENETVKAALESQMLVLKQNFEQQGIKVEAVEVTVASHAFERNLDSSQNGAGEEQTPEKKKSGRRISLTELVSDVEEEDLSDEDRIVAEMMKQNGNTVDYTV